MGQKKRIVPVETPKPAPNKTVSAAVKQECERALNALRRGNHTRALRVMKDACVKFDNSGLVYRVQGTVFVKAASVIDDCGVKQRHLRNAVDSARKAVELSPNSIEFSHFYANLLYEVASDGKEYVEVVAECERALRIEDPIDPAQESLQDESQQRISSSKDRIEHVRNELNSLIKKSNYGSLSTLMKSLGNGDENFRFIPIRRLAEDPLEVGLVQGRRTNEIKRANKTVEEKRKEIEVRVAAARLLQQKSELKNEIVEVDLRNGQQRAGERRRNSKKKGSNSERKDHVRTYWNSMSSDKKIELFTIRISDLKDHFGSSKDSLANGVLSEALLWAETNKTWMFWVCSKCGEKFVDGESHMQHVVQVHLGNLIPKLQSVLPKGVDNEWVEMLLSCSWKPLDVSAAVEMLGGESKGCGSELVEEFYSDTQTEENHDDCFKDAWTSSPENQKVEEYCNDSVVQGVGCDENGRGQHRNSDDNQKFVSCSLNWPVSDDAEREKLLENIHTLLETLIRNKLLSESHLKKVMQFTVAELQGIVSGSKLMSHFVDRTPVCICFLGALQLRNILKFLQDVSQSCGLGRYSVKGSSAVDDADRTNQVLETQEMIVLNDDASCLILDHQFLPNESSESFVGLTSKENAALANDSDSLLSWIFAGLTSGEQLTSWNNMKEEKAHKGMDIFRALEKEFFHLRNLCDRKCENLGYEEALEAVGDLCLSEVKRRDDITEFVHESLESVLRKRKQELTDSEHDVMSSSSRFELEAISNVLKQAEALNVNRFGYYEETYSGVSSQLYDLESGEGGDWKTKNLWYQLDTRIKDAIERQKEQLSTELSKLDAQLMRSVNEMQKLELKIEPVSAFDYRLILLPLLKSYFRAYLEFQAEKDAREKSDAATEALLAELALDSRKSVKGGSHNVKHAHEKSKDKKKNNKESKKSKATNGITQNGLAHDDAELDHSLVASDEDHPGLENVVSASIVDFRQEEEKQKLRIELEEEERKLEKILEYQRHLENEAKRSLLTRQLRKTSENYVDEGKAVQDFNSDYNNGEQDEQEQLKLFKLEQLVQKNEVAKDLANPLNTANSAPVLIGSSAVSDVQKSGIHHDTLKQVDPKGGYLEDGFLPCDKRRERKNRRQRNMAKLSDGKCQNMSPGKDTKNLSGVIYDNCVKERAGSIDSLGNASTFHLEENGTKPLRQLQAKDDDEEKFQADLNNALRQSLDTFKAHQNLLLVSEIRMQQRIPLAYSPGSNTTEVRPDVDGTDVFGTGLKNEVGEYNCFLNVIIQSLWHLRHFRDEFLSRSISEHTHEGDPCVVCALYDIFTALDISSTGTQREAVSPTALRLALSNSFPNSNFFQVGEMNDASEVLEVIFQCLHRAFTSTPSVLNAESVESNSYGDWDCANSACMAHSFFGMDIFERMNCKHCYFESRHLKYTSFFHNINANSLREVKGTFPESSFDELLNQVNMNHQINCDPEVGGCGRSNHIHHILSNSPRVFTTVLGWQNTCESVEHIKATLAALNTEIDISALYRGLDPKNSHNLVSVVCYYGQHYHCFAFSHDQGQWIMYDDKTVKVVGGWDDVVSICEKGHLQPQVLFFEAEG